MIIVVYIDTCKILPFSLSTYAFKSILKYPVMFNSNMKSRQSKFKYGFVQLFWVPFIVYIFTDDVNASWSLFFLLYEKKVNLFLHTLLRNSKAK